MFDCCLIGGVTVVCLCRDTEINLQPIKVDPTPQMILNILEQQEALVSLDSRMFVYSNNSFHPVFGRGMTSLTDDAKASPNNAATTTDKKAFPHRQPRNQRVTTSSHKIRAGPRQQRTAAANLTFTQSARTRGIKDRIRRAHDRQFLVNG